MPKNILCLLFVLSFLVPGFSYGQESAPLSSDAAATAELIRRAGARMREYRERFKDLTTEETQRVEE